MIRIEEHELWHGNAAEVKEPLHVSINVHKDSKLLGVKHQGHHAAVFFSNPQTHEKKETIDFIITPSNRVISEDSEYVDTFIMELTQRALHVFRMK